MDELEVRRPINLGPEVAVMIANIDEDGNYTGVAAEIKIDDVWYLLYWLCDGELAKDVAEVSDAELDAFIQRVKEMAHRNGCRFDASHLPELKDDFHNIKNTS